MTISCEITTDIFGIIEFPSRNPVAFDFRNRLFDNCSRINNIFDRLFFDRILFFRLHLFNILLYSVGLRRIDHRNNFNRNTFKIFAKADVVNFAIKVTLMNSLVHSIIAKAPVISQVAYIALELNSFHQSVIDKEADFVTEAFNTGNRPFVHRNRGDFEFRPTRSIGFVTDIEIQLSVAEAEDPAIAITSRRFRNQDVIEARRASRFKARFDDEIVNLEVRSQRHAKARLAIEFGSTIGDGNSAFANNSRMAVSREIATDIRSIIEFPSGNPVAATERRVRLIRNNFAARRFNRNNINIIGVFNADDCNTAFANFIFCRIGTNGQIPLRISQMNIMLIGADNFAIHNKHAQRVHMFQSNIVPFP